MSVLTAAAAPTRGIGQALRDYISLLKLRIVLLLDATAVGVMFPAAHGHPRLVAVAAVLVGGTLAAGGAHAINCWFDRDIDAAMSRTRRRPVPDGRIPAWHALALGIGLNVIAFAVLWAGANGAAALLAMSGTLIYVFVYTMLLKRWSPQNIVIGGAAGAVPPLVGWVAATGGLDLTALALFAVIFFWTPPHFWALAQMIRKDYARVSLPMLPVMAEASAKRQAIGYAACAALASLVPFLTGSAGIVYFAGAALLGTGLVAMTILDLRRSGMSRRVFGFSILYIALLFTLFAASPLLP